MGMDTVHSLLCHSALPSISTKNWSEVSYPLILLHFFSTETQKDINHDCYMSTCAPLSQPITLIQCPYAREQIFIWETLWPEERQTPLQRVNSHYPPSFSPRPFHLFMLNMALYFSALIWRSHCVSKKWSVDAQPTCLLYFSSELIYEVPTDKDRQPGENFSFFF